MNALKLELMRHAHEIVVAMVKRALEGDVDAARLVLELVGYLKGDSYAECEEDYES